MKPSLFTGCLFGVVALLMAMPGFSQIISRNDVVHGVRSSLEKFIAQTDPTLKIRSVFQRHDLKVDEGEVVWQIASDGDSLRPGRHSIAVDMLVGGKVERKINVAVVIKRSIEVPTVRRSLKRGQLVTAADIKWKLIEMARPIDGLVLDDEDVIGMATVRSVREGIPLRAKWFDEPLAVDRGDRVQVKLVQGSLVINTTAVALGKGRVGDMIQLKNPTSHIRYEAKVSAPGKARIQTW
jgi:flagellar basal body P-ring formation protein FlgA